MVRELAIDIQALDLHNIDLADSVCDADVEQVARCGPFPSGRAVLVCHFAGNEVGRTAWLQL